MRRLVLRIPWPTPSLNDPGVRQRWAYKTTKARWLRRVADAWFEAKAAAGRGPVIWVKPPRCRVRVTIERFGRMENALDLDNLMGGYKCVLDALRALQLIDEDRHAAIDLVARQPKNPYRLPAMWTQITLERLEQGSGMREFE